MCISGSTLVHNNNVAKIYLFNDNEFNNPGSLLNCTKILLSIGNI